MKNLFDKNKEFNQWIDAQNKVSKDLDAEIIAKSRDLDVLEMQEKYGELYRKLMLTTAIDFCMQALPDTMEKIRQIEYIKAMGLLEKMGLYKNGIMMVDRKGQTMFIDPILKYLNPSSSLHMKLKTDQRHNDCHKGSWNLMSELENVKGKRLVTGFIKGACDDANYLHTWIEFEVDGEEKVADYTLNAVMDKDFYYQVRSVKDEKLSIIGEDEFFAEKGTVEELIKNGDVGIRTYLYSRSEMFGGVAEK